MKHIFVRVIVIWTAMCSTKDAYIEVLDYLLGYKFTRQVGHDDKLTLDSL